MSENTRRGVCAAQRTYQHVSAAHRTLPAAARRGIGLVIREVDNPYFADVVLGAQEAAIESGLNVLVSSSEGDRIAERRAVAMLVEKEVAGIIINPLLDDQADLAHLFDLKWCNVPLVLLERVHGLHVSTVDVDNVAASRRAVSHLIHMGHRAILHFSGPPYSSHSSERLEGFRQGFIESRLVFSEDLVVPAGASCDDGYEAGLRCFGGVRPTDRPTAVTCYNDLVAIGLMVALAELGLRVPEDVSVVGFDNIEMCDYGRVPLTTMAVPARQMGRDAVRLVMEHAEEETHDDAPSHVRLESQLIVRASTGPPPTNHRDDA